MKKSLVFLKRVLPILLTALWLAFIFGNSLQNGVESGEQSKQVLEIVQTITEKIGILQFITEKFIRKAAHFTEFFILSLLICTDILFYEIPFKTNKLYISVLILSASSPICSMFAVLDETLQHFSNGRSPQVTDVLIDTAGAVFGVGIFILCFIIIRHTIWIRAFKKGQKSN